MGPSEWEAWVRLEEAQNEFDNARATWCRAAAVVSSAAEASERFGDDELERYKREEYDPRVAPVFDPFRDGDDDLSPARGIYGWVTVAVIGWVVVLWLIASG